LIEDNNTLGKPRVDYIEYWFENIVSPQTQTSLLHTLFDPIVVHFGHAPDFHALDLLVETPTFSYCWSPFQKLIVCSNGSI
jgi:hypothetical protein